MSLLSEKAGNAVHQEYLTTKICNQAKERIDVKEL